MSAEQKTVTVRNVDPALWRQFSVEAKTRGVTLASLLHSALRQLLGRRAAREKGAAK